jgi:hypothetical protein
LETEVETTALVLLPTMLREEGGIKFIQEFLLLNGFFILEEKSDVQLKLADVANLMGFQRYEVI